MIETLDQIIEDGFKRKLVHNYTSNQEKTDDNAVVIDNKKLINFGSCSYLSLENEQTLKQGVVNSVLEHGTQFSSSRTYLSIGLYRELEGLMRQIYKSPCIVTASTTLGHLATIPVIVGNKDAVILDLQVHSSVQMAVKLLKERRIPVYIVKHNCMESLEIKIKSLNNKFDKVWYFADGVYSMYGDLAPFNELKSLLNSYDKFHVYIDDAHGVSWYGENGCGVAKSNMGYHEKMYLSVSLNKSFASAGGCMVFPNEEVARKVRNCGSTYIFSGPIQPPMLGAAIASAKLHLSEKLNKKQKHLKELINYTNKKLDEFNFPQYKKTESPLFFIPAGLPKIAYDTVNKMKEEGFFFNVASFPAVPMKKSGLRFMINSSLNKENIDDMLELLQYKYLEALKENNSNCEEVAKTFKLPKFKLKAAISENIIEKRDELQVTLNSTILSESEEEWNTIFKENATLSYNNIVLVEKTFTNNEKKEDNWNFKYVDIKNASGKTILKTFFTVALTKDDMFSPAYISEKVENERGENSPYFLTSKTVVAGSLITKGNHLFLDKSDALWLAALEKLINILNSATIEYQASKLMIRDFYGQQDSEFETKMLELGFTKFQLPNNLLVNEFPWSNQEEYLKKLPQKYRYNVRKEVLKFEDKFIVSYRKPSSTNELLEMYRLYEQVFEKSYTLNVFKLPFSFFEEMATSASYDFIQLYLKPNDENEMPKLVGVMFSIINKNIYNAMIVGLDYKHVYEVNVYKQILYKTLQRAKEIGCSKLDFGFTADLEKKKLGAHPIEVYAYVQAAEHFSHSLLENI
ncbi:7-keto-8-aminopelargonate synthetase [Tenacibaculum sp. MAR_2009_124]|uniref:bifunctional aminotransferase class I/II-fold pyridoxal phosphate-dependent enzyme/GNAT family N-acetyltransferase n=1 Tax=Tenacibaculum sp. MAR_2009_124 TaxID=1250059 RepID=UPI000895169D|nr:bifunctional aminotransferase class I/II-fold pyridoxal phosphate-dependent enzyme/GNAT family N-acetyltransferase [Tenacibaculum sp. MAR_2009_124]SEC42093.1 7-keto-8-aminopelargonate synthetase [Tenacibaculum sp. MAR_2009_124]